MPRRAVLSLLPIALLVASGACGPDVAVEAPESTSAAQPPPSIAPPPSADDLEPDDPTLLRRPFTAEQIREEWVQGLTIEMHTWTPEKEIREMWTVLGVDEETMTLQSASLDEAGEIVGKPRIAQSTWEQLRDHASFAAAGTRRAEVVEQTPLGELEGWLYTAQEPGSTSVTEFFFAKSLPGTPVRVLIMEAGAPVMEMKQVRREKPEGLGY